MIQYTGWHYIPPPGPKHEPGARIVVADVGHGQYLHEHIEHKPQHEGLIEHRYASRVEEPAARFEQPARRLEQPAGRIEQPAARIVQPAGRIEHQLAGHRGSVRFTSNIEEPNLVEHEGVIYQLREGGEAGGEGRHTSIRQEQGQLGLPGGTVWTVPVSAHQDH